MCAVCRCSPTVRTSAGHVCSTRRVRPRVRSAVRRSAASSGVAARIDSPPFARVPFGTLEETAERTPSQQQRDNRRLDGTGRGPISVRPTPRHEPRSKSPFATALPNADDYARRSAAEEIRAITARRRSRATTVVDPSLIVSWSRPPASDRTERIRSMFTSRPR